MTKLMPATVRGTHVFRPSQGISGLDTFNDEDEDIPKDVPTPSGEEDLPTVDEEVRTLSGCDFHFNS
jgi:hypothetical protein